MSRTFPLLQNIEREKKKRNLRTSFFIEQNEAQRYSFLLLPKTTKQSETYKNTRKGRLKLRSLHAQTKHNLSNIHPHPCYYNLTLLPSLNFYIVSVRILSWFCVLTITRIPFVYEFYLSENSIDAFSSSPRCSRRSRGRVRDERARVH